MISDLDPDRFVTLIVNVVLHTFFGVSLCTRDDRPELKSADKLTNNPPVFRRAVLKVRFDPIRCVAISWFLKRKAMMTSASLPESRFCPRAGPTFTVEAS